MPIGSQTAAPLLSSLSRLARRRHAASWRQRAKRPHSLSINQSRSPPAAAPHPSSSSHPGASTQRFVIGLQLSAPAHGRPGQQASPTSAGRWHASVVSASQLSPGAHLRTPPLGPTQGSPCSLGSPKQRWMPGWQLSPAPHGRSAWQASPFLAGEEHVAVAASQVSVPLQGWSAEQGSPAILAADRARGVVCKGGLSWCARLRVVAQPHLLAGSRHQLVRLLCWRLFFQLLSPPSPCPQIKGGAFWPAAPTLARGSTFG